MIIDTTTKVERQTEPFPIREDCTVLPVLGKARIGWIETPIEECTWIPWEECPPEVRETGGWPGGWFAIPTCDLSAALRDKYDN